MILLHVAAGRPEGMYNVVSVIGCILEREGLFCASHMMVRELRMLAVCKMWEGKRMEV
jgi:hypothetical protein